MNDETTKRTDDLTRPGICSHCGSAITPGAHYCGRCGYSVSFAAREPAGSIPSTPATTEVQSTGLTVAPNADEPEPTHEAQRICLRCGDAIEPGKRFCGNCGTLAADNLPSSQGFIPKKSAIRDRFEWEQQMRKSARAWVFPSIPFGIFFVPGLFKVLNLYKQLTEMMAAGNDEGAKHIFEKIKFWSVVTFIGGTLFAIFFFAVILPDAFES